jgi:hypothetical protein
MSTVSTRFLVISDTHNFQFGDETSVRGEFHHPPLKPDVLLHCGDLTQVGGLSSYKSVLKFLGSIDAELKLVIAGNHDLDLDGRYWETHLGQVHNDAKQHEKAMEIMKGDLAKEAGVTYLEEGLHTFTLKNGAKFTIYTSPYTPEFYDWGFPYERNEDRFNRDTEVAEGVKSIAKNPIPDFPGVDIIMTHGPPKDILDWTAHGTVGCDNLLRAVSRARPRMHCFGHIHEAYGAIVVTWKSGEKLVGPKLVGAAAIQNEIEEKNIYPEPKKQPINFGKETLMVNAAVMNLSYKPTNAPWLVDLDLPRAT